MKSWIFMSQWTLEYSWADEILNKLMNSWIFMSWWKLEYSWADEILNIHELMKFWIFMSWWNLGYSWTHVPNQGAWRCVQQRGHHFQPNQFWIDEHRRICRPGESLFHLSWIKQMLLFLERFWKKNDFYKKKLKICKTINRIMSTSHASAVLACALSSSV